MKLLALGDSFTVGDELADRSLSWPSLLASKLNYFLVNRAESGGGNTQIVRKVVEQAHKFDLVVIGWTMSSRVEVSNPPLVTKKPTTDVWAGQIERGVYAHNQLIKLLPDLYSDDYFFRQYLINVLLVQEYLKSKQIRYVMCNAFGYDSNYHFHTCANNHNDLMERIDPTYFIGWPKLGMSDWAKEAPRGPGGHFLELGHKQVADTYYEYIRNLGWIS